MPGFVLLHHLPKPSELSSNLLHFPTDIASRRYDQCLLMWHYMVQSSSQVALITRPRTKNSTRSSPYEISQKYSCIPEIHAGIEIVSNLQQSSDQDISPS
jgi:hypothetical protein